ncbi:MAG: septum formation initiator family protein [Spirochaetales bacterium]|nr:septum formation initiator family protein [Spirochaetales bacterium]
MKFYWPLLAALIFYSLLSFFWGSTGLQALKEMELRKKQLESNLAELSSINSQLNQDLLSLGSDHERIAVQSRNLGYLQEQEKMLFVNIGSIKSRQFDVGRILYLENVEKSPGTAVKWGTVLVFAAGQALVLVYRRRKPAFEPA